MIDPDHPRLSIVRQCELVLISRSSFYREPMPESAENLALMRLICQGQSTAPPSCTPRIRGGARCETTGLVRVRPVCPLSMGSGPRSMITMLASVTSLRVSVTSSVTSLRVSVTLLRVSRLQIQPLSIANAALRSPGFSLMNNARAFLISRSLPLSAANWRATVVG
jgi:hypothetical protein